MAYYNYDKINSYNCCFNFILTNRGYGKSYGSKAMVIRNFLKRKEQFVYCRRYKTELTEFIKFFDDIRQAFPNHKFEIKGKTAYIDDEICGYAIPLSMSQKYKSTPYPNVTTIIFDEFIIDTSTCIMRYISNEVEMFLDLFETVARKRDNVKAYLLANFITEVNPYFIFFNVTPKKGERFTLARNGELIIDVSKSDEFIKEKENTRFGRLIAGTKYSDYALNNEALRDSNAFIEKLSLKNMYSLCTLSDNKRSIGLYQDTKTGMFYCCSKIDKNVKKFVLELEAHDNTAILNSRITDYPLFKIFVKGFQLGQTRFDTQSTKIFAYECLKKLGVK